MTYFNKIGPHIQSASSGASQWAANSNIVKGVDDTSGFGSAPSSAILVFRHFMGDGDQQYQGKTGASVADLVISKLGRGPQSNLYIEGPNECGLDDLANYINFMRDFTTRAHSHPNGSYKVAGFSMSVGNPQPDQVTQMRAAGWAGVDAIAIHEYWDNNGPTYQYTALRHRIWHQGGDPDVVITEAGRLCIGQFSGANPGDCSFCKSDGCGWHDFNLTCAQYDGECQTYDQAISADGYVLGATLFTTGGGGFSSNEINDLLPCIAGTPPVTCGTQNAACCTSGAPCSRRPGLSERLLCRLWLRAGTLLCGQYLSGLWLQRWGNPDLPERHLRRRNDRNVSRGSGLHRRSRQRLLLPGARPTEPVSRVQRHRTLAGRGGQRVRQNAAWLGRHGWPARRAEAGMLRKLVTADNQGTVNGRTVAQGA